MRLSCIVPIHWLSCSDLWFQIAMRVSPGNLYCGDRMNFVQSRLFALEKKKVLGLYFSSRCYMSSCSCLLLILVCFLRLLFVFLILESFLTTRVVLPFHDLALNFICCFAYLYFSLTFDNCFSFTSSFRVSTPFY